MEDMALMVMCIYCNKILEYRKFEGLGIIELQVDTCSCREGEICTSVH